ncbi:MAG: endo-1,4-beta-xylanase [Phycisphaerae bacterium]|nr:endo-1,4-beta-xylanase [Phycisphaerae bacterium]
MRFRAYIDGKPAASLNLGGSHLVGSDGVPLLAEIGFKDGQIVCSKRPQGPAGLSLLWQVKGFGKLMLETTRLPDEDACYNLNVELARSRLLRIAQKREDWGLFDLSEIPELEAGLDKSRDLFVESLKAEDPAAASKLADQSLLLSCDIGEKLSLYHADAFMARRRQSASFSRRTFGCAVDLLTVSEGYQRRLLEGFDFLQIPIVWRRVEPKEQEFNWGQLDAWVEWLTKHRVPIKAAPLVAFNEGNVPDWLYIWEHDFETVRDLVYDHINRVAERYGNYVHSWEVISAIHAENCFNFNFEQLMELTRMAATLTKQLSPRSTTIVNLIAPWGEYYARNQRTIPPMLYADMAVQSGINFDAFGLQFFFGVPKDGMYVRDLLQISSMVDRFALLGKPLHITAVQVPSTTTADEWDAWGGNLSVEDAGFWHAAWTEELQARWLRDFIRIALSRPFVESVAWRDLADYEGHYLPHGGLLNRDLSPKKAYAELLRIRRSLPRPEDKRRKRPSARR